MSYHAEESNESVSEFDRLSKELIIEILIRIPSKPLCRLKSVSKRFNSIISDPKFLPLYVSRVSLPSSWFILDRNPQFVPDWEIHDRNPQLVTESAHPTQFQLVDPPKISTCTINTEKLTTDPTISTQILQTSNGLILFSLTAHHPRTQLRFNPNELAYVIMEECLFVVNPITSEWVGLSKPDNCTINNQSHIGFTSRVDPESGLVTRFMAVEYRPTIESNYGILLCFVSDTGKWVEKTANYMLGSHSWSGDVSFEFEGKLFWVDLSTGLITWDFKDNDYFTSVESYEMAVCRFIPVPVNKPGLEGDRWVGGGGGFIQFIEVFKEGQCVLNCWRLKNYEGGDEWSLMYNVSRENVERFLSCETGGHVVGGSISKMPKPCFVDPFEADVAYFETGDFIFSFNLRTQMVGTVDVFTPKQNVVPFVLPKWPSPIPNHLKRLYAAYTKEEGNECFKKQKFIKAIECYSISIDVSPNAASFANRAMAYLKVDNYQEAENDCTESLKFDANQFKVYWRRGLARKGLGNLKGALEDIELGLKLEPGNREVKKLHVELKSMLEKVSSEVSESGMEEDAACGMDVKAEGN